MRAASFFLAASSEAKPRTHRSKFNRWMITDVTGLDRPNAHQLPTNSITSRTVTEPMQSCMASSRHAARQQTARVRRRRLSVPRIGVAPLCQGKGLVVIFDYIQTVGLLRSGVLFPDNGPGPVSRLGKVQEHRVSRKRQALSPNCRGSGPPVESGPPRKSRTPHGVPDPLYSNRTPH